MNKKASFERAIHARMALSGKEEVPENLYKKEIHFRLHLIGFLHSIKGTIITKPM